MKHHNVLESTLEKVGRILSRKYNITVRCRANECKTNGRTIWLPALPDKISDSLWILIRGMLDHETAHILFSDFDGKMKDFRQKHGNFGFDLLNVIEDVRVNEAMQKEYPGSQENILHSINEITQKHQIDQMPLPVRFLCALFLAGSNIPYDLYGVDTVELVNQFKCEFKQFKSLRSTNEACEMVECILQQLKHIMEEQQQGRPANSQQSGDKKDSHESQIEQSSTKHPDRQEHTGDQHGNLEKSQELEEQNTESQQNPKDSTCTEGESQDGQKNGSNSSDAAESNQQSGTSQNESSDQKSKSIHDVLSGNYISTGNPFEIQKSVQDQVETEYDDTHNQSYRVYDPSLDQVITPKNMDRGEVYQQLSSEVRPHIGTLRQQLIRTLRAKDTRFWVGDQEEGLINSKKLYALLNQGSDKVFRQIKECDSDSVAISLLIDLSGSMSGARIQMTRQVAILFTETLHQLRIPSEVIGFTTVPSKSAFAKLFQETGMTLEEISKLYARFFPCVYSIFKAFHEPFKVIKPRVPAMRAMEYTPIDDAILFTGKRLSTRNETRKIILILTDGEPYTGNPILQHTITDHLKQNLQLCQRAGIECVAVGIQTDYVKRYFQEHVVVQNLPELPKAFYTKFSELLRKSHN